MPENPNEGKATKLDIAELRIFCSKLKQSASLALSTRNFLAKQKSFPDSNKSLTFIPLSFAVPQAANHLSQKDSHTVNLSSL